MTQEIMQRIEKGIQYRDMRMSPADVADRMVVQGYATTFNDPYVLYEDEEMRILEAIDAGAFNGADMTDVIMQYDHRGHVFARVRNNTLDIRTDDKGLFISADLGGTEIGRQLYTEIKGGYTDKMSFAFTVTGENVDRRTEGTKRVITRTITQIGKLYDVSAVSIPANDGTTISARSFCDGIIKKELEEAQIKRANERTRKLIALRLKLMEV
jgi:HK97 family phage prohead protease